jgi:hypothetical protein
VSVPGQGAQRAAQSRPRTKPAQRLTICSVLQPIAFRTTARSAPFSSAVCVHVLEAMRVQAGDAVLPFRRATIFWPRLVRCGRQARVGSG